MKYYFESIEKQRELRVILEEWLNTPFRHHVGVKQVGCDCIHFAVRVFEEMGIIRWRKDMIQNYAYDGHLHHTRGLLPNGIEKEFNVEKRGLISPMNGDIFIFHIGNDDAHASIYFDDYLYQSLTDIGVVKIKFGLSNRVFRKEGQMSFSYRIIA